jgi:hypothetical protein
MRGLSLMTPREAESLVVSDPNGKRVVAHAGQGIRLLKCDNFLLPAPLPQAVRKN